MAYLADTNVIARWALPDDPLHALARSATLALYRQGETIYIVPQNITEYWALATRPAEANGLGLNIAQVRADIRNMEAAFSLLPDAPDIYSHWLILAETYGVVGRQVYDARLVAAMQMYGLTHILTFNPTHFRRFPGITVVHPQDVVP